MNDERKFLGTGWAFHPQGIPETGEGWVGTGVNPRGSIAMSSGTRDVEEAIYIILMTAKGERVMRPNFGCSIHDLVFMPNDADTHGLINLYIREALGWFEPRITVDNVEITLDPKEDNRLLITVHYTIKSFHDARSLVFPFYLLPGEGDETPMYDRPRVAPAANPSLRGTQGTRALPGRSQASNMSQSPARARQRG